MSYKYIVIMFSADGSHSCKGHVVDSWDSMSEIDRYKDAKSAATGIASIEARYRHRDFVITVISSASFDEDFSLPYELDDHDTIPDEISDILPGVREEVYLREENARKEKERRVRAAAAKREKALQEERERKEFERLKKKFESDTKPFIKES